MAKHYAWSDLYAGGEVKEVQLPANRGKRSVVTKRNIIPRGEEVTKTKIKVTDEEWDHLVETGSIRPYPIPEGAGESISPTRAFLVSITDPATGEIDQDILMGLSLKHPDAINPPAEEEAEVPAGA